MIILVYNLDLDREDWFSVYIKHHHMNVLTTLLLILLMIKEKFDVSMVSFGIGARLQRNDYTEDISLVQVVPLHGGKKLEPSDVYLKVGQGESCVDIVGMKLTKLLKKNKGPKDTKLRLLIKEGN
jgi:carboxyl-terminal processing protease